MTIAVEIVNAPHEEIRNTPFRMVELTNECLLQSVIRALKQSLEEWIEAIS